VSLLFIIFTVTVIKVLLTRSCAPTGFTSGEWPYLHQWCYIKIPSYYKDCALTAAIVKKSSSELTCCGRVVLFVAFSGTSEARAVWKSRAHVFFNYRELIPVLRWIWPEYRRLLSTT